METYKYTVSVCVPVYNAESYLRDCVESLLGQTLKSLELIFVNDGSTDASRSILDSYAKIHSNIVIINQENQGLGGARNSAINVAQGEFVGFVDADDKVAPTMFQELFEVAAKNNADLAMCDVKIFPEGAKKNKWYTPFTGSVDGDFLYKNTQPWNKIVKRELIDQSDFKFYRKNGDGMFIILMLLARKIVSIDKPLYLYRAGHPSMSTNYRLDNFQISIESCELQLKELEKTRYKDSLHDFFDFRMIHILIQATAVAAFLNEKQAFLEYRNRLCKMHYRNNQYTKRILRREFGTLKYFGMVYILPISYHLSRVVTRIVI